MKLACLVLLLLVPHAASLSAAEQAGVGALRSAEWRDGAGNVHTGITGDGVAIWSGELYDPLHDDVEQCVEEDRHALFVTDDVDPVYYPGGDTNNHGNFIAGVLCGDGTRSGGLYQGIAFDAAVYSWWGYCPECGGLASWFEDPAWRVYTWSTDANDLAALERHGMPEDTDVLFVAAVGNGGGDGSTAQTAPYLHSDPRLMGVAAAGGSLDEVALYSSRGSRTDESTWPDLTAPGCILSIAPPPWADYYALSASNWAGQRLGLDVCPDMSDAEFAEATAAGYVMETGTSFAAPVVAGTAALMFEVNPVLSAHEARFLLTRTADIFMPTEDQDGDGNVTQQDFYRQHGFEAGWGLLNATRAVAAAHYLRVVPSSTLEEAVSCATFEEGVLNRPAGTCIDVPSSLDGPDAEPTNGTRDHGAGPTSQNGPSKRSPSVPALLAPLAATGIAGGLRRARDRS